MPQGSMSRPATTTTTTAQASQVPCDAALASAIRGRKSRPVSWHPASAKHAGYFTPHIPPSTSDQSASASIGVASQPLNTVPVPSYWDSSSNMVSYPSQPDFPLSNDSFTPFPGMESTPMQQQQPQQQPSMTQMDLTADPWDVDTSSISTMPPPMPDTWTFDMMAMNTSMPSADIVPLSYESVPSSGGLSGPSTPDFLPIQNFDQPIPPTKEPDVELVGMGLHNNPGTAAEPSPLQGISGKGLKLEESFSPSSDNEEDKDKGGSEDDHLTALDQPGPSLKQPAKPTMDLLEKSFFLDDDLEPHGLPDVRLFNLDQSCMSYGYGWI